jgi:S-adenosylmethionine uptake transporter
MQSLWMLLASFVFALMGVCVKLASDLYSTSEIVMYRGIIGVLVMLALIRWHGGTLKTSLPWQHFWRGIIGVTALWLWFFSFGRLPLATAVTLNYMAPIWIAAILFIVGWRRGQIRFEWGLAAAIAMSFIGVTLLLRPSVHAEQWLGAIFALISGVVSAFAYLQVRHLGQLGEPEYRVVFYFSLTGLIAGLLGSLVTRMIESEGAVTWHAHTGTGLALLLGIGISATVAQIAMTRAYRLGKVLITANLQYTGIVFSSILGILIWGDLLDWLGWLGIAVILASGIVATFYNARNAKAAGLRTISSETDPITTEA